MAVLIGGVIYVSTAGALHFFIGSLADWASRLGPLLGQDGTLALIQAQYEAVMPALLFSYGGMLLLILGSLFALVSGRTILPRKMLACHMLVWQVLLVLIPDIRQLSGAAVSTLDFVLSQGSGNGALCIWMLAGSLWAGRQIRNTEE